MSLEEVDRMLELLAKKQRTVKELSEILSLSEETIKLVVDFLCKYGFAERSDGMISLTPEGRKFLEL